MLLEQSTHTLLFRPTDYQDIYNELHELHDLYAAKKLYQGLQIEDYVTGWICEDATTYRLPDDLTIHLVISETMLNALRKEPQVEIMLNLVPQLDEKALFIPSNITVSAQLLDGYKETYRYLEPEKTPERLNLGTVYSIGREQCEPHRQVTIEIVFFSSVKDILVCCTNAPTF